MQVLATDGHLPYPFGHEITGYQVQDLTATLKKAKAASVEILPAPYTTDNRTRDLGVSGPLRRLNTQHDYAIIVAI